MTFREFEVDGVPTVFEQQESGTSAGGLVFRVGWADETLAVRGLTRLVTRLVVAALASEVRVHGEVGAVLTRFEVAGTADQVARGLSGVCAALRDLPLEHLEPVRDRLAAEEVPTGRADQEALRLRYGARGHGLDAYPELGVDAIDADLLRLWVDEAFTRGNAALWLSGEDVPGPLLLPLVDGRRQPVPPAAGLLPATPAWAPAPDQDLLHVTGVVGHSPASEVFASLLRTAVDRDLRRLDATSSTSAVSYAVRDGGSAVVRVVADCLDGRGDAAAASFVDCLARLRWGGLTQDEVEAARADARDTASAGSGAHGVVAAAADNQLLASTPGPQEPDAGYAAVGAADLVAAAESFARSALAQVPGSGLGWAGWHPAQVEVPTVVGREHVAREHPGTVLVIADEGVTTRSGGTPSTVRFDDVAVALSFADGGRWLVGTDGSTVEVEPTLYDLDPAELAALDGALDAARVVLRPARGPDELRAAAESVADGSAPAPDEEPEAAPDPPRTSRFRLGRRRH